MKKIKSQLLDTEKNKKNYRIHPEYETKEKSNR